ncbi:MAG: hypothetical protein K5919_00840, partial [Clostridiales bacterium]|nr:hypothetical protein [Clostridiales bacterium]
YINATKIAQEIGLGNRTNTILQSAFFRITEVIPVDKAQPYRGDAQPQGGPAQQAQQHRRRHGISPEYFSALFR